MDERVVLGPMSGYTFTSYRDFMRPFGVGLAYTEMISAMGLVHNQQRTDAFIKFRRNGVTGVQLFGNDPEALALGAEKALETNPDIDLFDVNMGCPVPKVTRNGSGSALMKDPVKCGEIVRAMKHAVDVPVTAKIRLGWSSQSINFREVMDELVSADVDAVTVHARTTKENYTGKPHYDLLEGLGKEIPVPLIVSGNIYSPDDAVSAMGLTDAQGVMVARGGVGNPYLVTQINDMLETGSAGPNPTVHQQILWCIQLADMMIAELGEERAMKKIRSIAPKFVIGIQNCHGYRLSLAHDFSTRDRLLEHLESIDSEVGDHRILYYGRAESPFRTDGQ